MDWVNSNVDLFICNMDPVQCDLRPYQAHLQSYHVVIACVFHRLADRVHVEAHTIQHFGLVELCSKKRGEATAAAEPKAADL